MIKRLLENTILSRFSDKKAVIVLGARQVGKTTLIKETISNKKDVLWLNGDDLATQQLLRDVTTQNWKAIIGKNQLLIIDEAQRIEDIGIKIKLITDQLDTKVILSGSSSLELANNINEPLTGRKWEYTLYPVSFSEMVNYTDLPTEHSALSQRLTFGYYPEVINEIGREQEILSAISDSYLYKDLFAWQGIRKPEKLKQLLQALAFQIGSEVSYNELGKQVGLDNQSIEQYIDLLEKNFIIFRLPPLSRNLRKELKSKRKIYFWDLGIRNAVIAQFQPLNLRQDRGALFENWFIVERMKLLEYQGLRTNFYFWRTQDQQEIDFIEDRNGNLTAYQIKWNPNKKVRFSKTFTRAYPNHDLKVVNSENYFNYLLHS